MEFLFDLLLTAFFSLLFAFLLSKLFSPSPSTSTSPSGSSHGAADVITGGAHSTEEDRPEETRAPRLREGEDLQEEKIIEMDKVVEKEVETGFLAEEGRSELSQSVGIGGGKVTICEGIEGMSCGFVSDVGFEKEMGDRGLVEKDDSFESETSIDFDKEKESCASEVGDGKVAESSDLISVHDQSFLLPEESLGEAKSIEPEVENDDIDNLCEVEGLKSKMSMKVATEEETHLKEEHAFKIDSRSSVILQEEISQEVVVSGEFEKGKDEEHNLCEVEGFASKTATEGEAHSKELTVPEEILVETMESSAHEKGEEGGEENLSKVEGPSSKTTQFVGVGEKEKEKAFNEEEEEWEGIERTDLEKRFAVAAGYATSACGTDSLSKLSSEVQLQLYGLHKVATEGPCYESHPLALRASTRAKWYG